MFETLVLLALACVVGLVTASKTRQRLRGLEMRLNALEQKAAAMGAREAPEAAAIKPPPVEPSRPALPPLIPPSEPADLTPTTPPPAPPILPKLVPVTVPVGPSLEERFGTQWVVWVGGVAIAFGGFFLVRYSIEQGWFGPGMRVFLGALLAIALIAAGEWARRTENLRSIGGLPSAHIPSILTVAGTAVAYADVWAAY